MAYRGDDSADALEAPSAEGLLRVALGPNRLDLTVAQRSLHIADGTATLVEHKKKKQERRASIKLDGPLVVARGFPREAFGIWIELPPDPPKKATKNKKKPDTSDPVADIRAMQRVFGVEPPDLLAGDGLANLAKLDTVAHRVRTHLENFAPVRRGIEIGSGHALDKVLLADHGDRYVVYARRLFRDRARYAMTIHADGRILVPDGRVLKEVTVTSKFGVTVRGDYVRFADPHGTDLARVSVPWIGPEDRDELARRIGQLVHRS
ncbi:MAG TPA: hypothetical protein VLB44_12465 [Kofleriaceae bacterium]|nr:hypothetical protein [Kofleriaceae bacterium]